MLNNAPVRYASSRTVILTVSISFLFSVKVFLSLISFDVSHVLIWSLNRYPRKQWYIQHSQTGNINSLPVASLSLSSNLPHTFLSDWHWMPCVPMSTQQKGSGIKIIAKKYVVYRGIPSAKCHQRYLPLQTLSLDTYLSLLQSFIHTKMGGKQMVGVK